MNRVGDMLLSIGFFAMVGLFGTVDFAVIYSLAPAMNETAITIIALLLFGGAMAKSAQLPLHTWLPGSMEAPTPVSALLHAATLVKWPITYKFILSQSRYKIFYIYDNL